METNSDPSWEKAPSEKYQIIKWTSKLLRTLAKNAEYKSNKSNGRY